LHRPEAAPPSLAVLIAGVAAMIFYVVLQVGALRLEARLNTALTLTGFWGLWLVLNGLLVLNGDTLPPWLVLVTAAFGRGLMLTTGGFSPAAAASRAVASSGGR